MSSDLIPGQGVTFIFWHALLRLMSVIIWQLIGIRELADYCGFTKASRRPSRTSSILKELRVPDNGGIILGTLRIPNFNLCDVDIPV